MLCRILTELKLLSTPVGIIVLSAGVGNDVVGWILLALCVALVNAGSGITALWVLLTCLGWVLFLVFAVRPCFLWALRRTNALTDGPSQGIVVLTLIIALTSAFFTGIIGVHPIVSGGWEEMPVAMCADFTAVRCLSRRSHLPASRWIRHQSH